MREEEKKSSQDSSFKRFMKKRWVFPAIYIASAALILSGVLWFQNSNNSATDSDQFDYNATDVPGKNDEPALEVNRALENFVMPVEKTDTAVIQKGFYDLEADDAEQEAALVFYNNTYHPNTGIDIAMPDGEPFEVRASLSGTVTKVQEDSLLGNVIEIEHDEGIVSRYQSVTDMSVAEGDVVEQGQALATAGKSLINEEAGVHVHFELRKDGIAVNPESFFNKSLSELKKVETVKDKTEQLPADDATEIEGGTDEESAPSDEGKTDAEEGTDTEKGSDTETDSGSDTNPETNPETDTKTDTESENSSESADA
ncbi:peptidoglycan DD-metalloendopeptidase family protein [Cytobacillus horneckiae]|uniref:peptidoglycan DD-metalloendopeptidase family protein n=1 Tax=Cytobacillus horneckiae TaxID=549687 RepID=UPI00203E6D40|nr:peptidoglycan DD-metalloendopeptidase family protein [Cytobacillus horneckiae]MCM3179187.1 peptidoglycan DD-metalloendopeptidase family protein [Cytobacillus horneckiae]